MAYCKKFFHIMVSEFHNLLWYLDYIIKEYFINYASHNSDLIIKTKTNDIKILNNLMKIECINYQYW